MEKPTMEVAAARAVAVADALPGAAIGLGLLYVVFAGSHPLFVPAPLARLLSPFAAATGAILLGFGVLFRRWPVLRGQAHALAAFVAGMACLNGLLHLALTKDPAQTTNLMLVVGGVGAFFASWRWFGGVVGTSLGFWLLIALSARPSADWTHFGFGLLSATVLAALLQHVRLVGIERHAEGQRRLATVLGAARAEARTALGVLDALPASLYIVDRELRVVVWNHQREEGTLGKPRSAVVGQLLPDVLGPQGWAAARPSIERVMAKGDDVDETIWTQGGKKAFRVIRVPVVMDGVITHVVSWFEDVTVRENAQRALHQTQEGFHLLFEMNPVPMLVYDLDTLALVEVNAALVRHYGYSREEFLAKRVVDLDPPEDLPEAMERIAQVRRDPATSGIHRARHRRADGRLIDVEATGHGIEFANRRARLVVVHDVTEEKRVRGQVLQSQKMEAIGLLAGGIAHDFNNLMTAVVGYSDLLLGRLAADDPHRDQVLEIQKAGLSAAALTRELLAFGQKQLLKPRILDLREVVDASKGLLGRVIGEDVRLVVRAPRSLGFVEADPVQIQQVIVNLAVNARDAMPRGGTLTIEVVDVSASAPVGSERSAIGPWVEVRVSDTGTGMDAETQARIFEPFFTTKEAGKGTGLGLATVYGIVTQSGGRIAVESAPGRGTTFRIRLPRAYKTLDARENDTPLDLPPGSETVLVVEDEAVVRTLARSVLEACGYRVLVASDGEHALELCEREPGPIHLLLSDIVMPGMSGTELAEQVRVGRPETRILLASGYSEEAIATRGFVAEGVELLPKPYTASGLARKVREVLNGVTGPRPLERR